MIIFQRPLQLEWYEGHQEINLEQEDQGNEEVNVEQGNEEVILDQGIEEVVLDQEVIVEQAPLMYESYADVNLAQFMTDFEYELLEQQHQFEEDQTHHQEQQHQFEEDQTHHQEQ
ncbi:hypothetical protein L1987_22853 [Smallanthus sonchifolius]|uniref:Uncharacterized protein n=1 Tax=Smallanthus sonchifolius TaxID=185202 RepID=A0ACB9IHI0_9ASTR|nr:hypothetical protein L1987_22853 [Smallanthus sonchifolius]